MHFSSFAAILGLATGVAVAGEAAGNSRLNPVFVDPVDDLTVSLIPQGVYLDSHQLEVFEKLVSGIVYAQYGFQEASPSLAGEFDDSIELWEYLLELIPNYQDLKQNDYIDALKALREATKSLSHCEEEYIPKLRKLTGKLLIDNLVLVGVLNDIYGVDTIPPYLVDWPGEVIGALIHFLAIDVTQSIRL